MSGFDSQFYQPDLYRHDDAEEAEHLLPYPTIVTANGDDIRIPGLLRFVQSNWFYSLTGVVVIVNMAVSYLWLISSALSSSSQWGFWVADQVFLVYYCMEVLLRLAHFKWWFFFHRHDAKWNFFDLTIVATGAVDQWIFPLLASRSRLNMDTWLPLLRAVRILKLLRLIKLVGAFMRSDFRWTTSVWFNSLVSLVIMFSIVIMGIETDVKSPIWEPIDDLILGFFVFEVAVKMRRQGLQFFISEGWIWNVLDFFIVVFGVVDQWLLNLWMVLVRGGRHRSKLGDVLLLIRMLRLLRILRLLRLVKAVRPLYLLALGVMEAMQSMFWVLVLTLVSLYTVGILMTRVVGHGAMADDTNEIPEVTQGLFRTVPESMFTLFVIMNGEEWRKVEPLLARYMGMKFLFVLFTIFSSWALLSVMTGVVSDNMISAKKSQNLKDDAMTGERRSKIERVLHEFFTAADDTGIGRLSKERYFMMLDIPFYARKMQAAAPNCSPKDLREMFVWLDAEGGEVDQQEFVRGFHTFSEPLTGKALLHVDAEVKRRFKKLEEQVISITSDLAEERRREVEHHQELLAMLDEDAPLRPLECDTAQ